MLFVQQLTVAFIYVHGGNLPLCLAPENGPHQVPEKELCPEFPKGNLTLGGVRFPGEPKWKIGSPRVQHCLFLQDAW